MRAGPAVLGVTLALSVGCAERGESPGLPVPAEYVQQEEGWRAGRDREFATSPFSRLALIERTPVAGGRVTIGRSRRANLRLEGKDVSAVHAIVEGREPTILVRAVGRATLETLEEPPQRRTRLTLNDHEGFRIGRFNIRYVLHEDFGPLLETYDPEIQVLREFEGLDYFAVDPAYRVAGEIAPYPEPEAVTLLDSQGQQRPYWVYGELRFTLNGTGCRLELYTPALEEVGKREFMLIFQDETSGTETYPAGRYLYVEGKPRGRVVVDFNRAFSPPCNYSKVFSCPFPRPGNRLLVAIRAGQKWYRATGL